MSWYCSCFMSILCWSHYLVPGFQGFTLRGCLHYTRATFTPAWVHSGSLSWLYICVHNTITKCHAVASHPEVSSFRLLYWSEVKNFTMASCKREMTTCFGVKSVCKLTGMGGTCIMFPIWFTHVFYQHVVYIQITKIWNDPSSYKHNTKSKRHPGMKLGPVQFCHVNNP